jgi:uncharacterized membrane protein YhhN
VLNFWFFFTILFAGVDWLALWLKKPQMNFVSKPAVLISLIFWFSSLDGWSKVPFWFGLALVFSLIGDIMLLFPDRCFLSGLIAFLVAQVCYVIGLSPQAPVDTIPFFIIGLSALGVGSVLYNNLRKRIETDPVHKKLATPILIYSIAISMMLFSAVLTLAEPDWTSRAAVLVAAGGMLFFTSDALLSSNRFIQPIPNGQLLVRILYHLGQISLTAGVLVHFLE